MNINVFPIYSNKAICISGYYTYPKFQKKGTKTEATAVPFYLFTILNYHHSCQPISCVYFSNWPITLLGESKKIKKYCCTFKLKNIDDSAILPVSILTLQTISKMQPFFWPLIYLQSKREKCCLPTGYFNSSRFFSVPLHNG